MDVSGFYLRANVSGIELLQVLAGWQHDKSPNLTS
jgi:hypothetical protein